jgi:hypothetical protein
MADEKNTPSADEWAQQYEKDTKTAEKSPDNMAALRERQAGGTDIEKQGKASFAYKHPFASGLARGAATLGGIIPESTHAEDYSFIPTIKSAFENPSGTLEAAGDIAKGMWGAQKDRWNRFKQGVDISKQQETGGHPVKAIGTMAAAVPYGVEAVVPGVGPWIGGMADKAEHAIRTRDPYEGGEVVGGAIAGGAAGGGNDTGAAHDVGKAAGEKVAPAIPEVVRHPREAMGKIRWESPVPDRVVQGRLIPGGPASGKLNPFTHNVEHAAGIVGGGVVGSAIGHPVVGAIAGGAFLPGLMDKFAPEPTEWREGREAHLFDLNRAAEDAEATEAYDKLLKTRAGIPPTAIHENLPNAPQRWNGPVPPEAITEHTVGRVAPPIGPNEGIPPGFDIHGERRTTPFGGGETELEPTRHAGPMDVPKDWMPNKRELGKPALGEKEIAPPKKPGAGKIPGTTEKFPQGYNAEPEGKQEPGLQSKIPTGRGSMPKEEEAPRLNAQRREEDQLFTKLFGTELEEAENLRPDETQILPKRVTNEALKAPKRPTTKAPKFAGATAPGVVPTEIPAKAATPAPDFNVVEEGGVRWAVDPNDKTLRVGIPKRITEPAEIEAFAKKELAAQVAMRAEHRAFIGTQQPVTLHPTEFPGAIEFRGGNAVPGQAPELVPTLEGGRSAAAEAKNKIGGGAEVPPVLRVPMPNPKLASVPQNVGSVPRPELERMARTAHPGAEEQIRSLGGHTVIVPGLTETGGLPPEKAPVTKMVIDPETGNPVTPEQLEELNESRQRAAFEAEHKKPRKAGKVE